MKVATHTPTRPDSFTAWIDLHRRYISAREPVEGLDVAGVARSDEGCIAAAVAFRTAERDLLLAPAPDVRSLIEKFAALHTHFVAEAPDGNARLFLSAIEADVLRLPFAADEEERSQTDTASPAVPKPATGSSASIAGGARGDVARSGPWNSHLEADQAIEDLWRQIEVVDLAVRGLKALSQGSAVSAASIDAVLDVTSAATRSVERLRALFENDDDAPEEG